MKIASILVALVASMPACAASSYVYVANQGSNTVSEIDRTLNKVIVTIPVPNGPTQIALNPNGKYLYVTTQAKNVAVISTVTNTVIDTVSFYGSPSSIGQIAVSPDGAVAYVANVTPDPYQCFPFGCQGSIAFLFSAFSTSSYEVTEKFTDESGISISQINGVALTPNGSLLFGVDSTFSRYLVYSTATNSVINIVPLPTSVPNSNLVWYHPLGIAITPDGMSAFISDQYSGGNGPANIPGIVWRMATTGNAQPTAHFLVGANPVGISINPNGRFGYTVNSGDDTVTVFCALANVVLRTIPVGKNPQGIAVTSDGGFAYVTNTGSNTISEINTETNEVVATIPVGNTPIGVVVTR